MTVTIISNIRYLGKSKEIYTQKCARKYCPFWSYFQNVMLDFLVSLLLWICMHIFWWHWANESAVWVRREMLEKRIRNNPHVQKLILASPTALKIRLIDSKNYSDWLNLLLAQEVNHSRWSVMSSYVMSCVMSLYVMSSCVMSSCVMSSYLMSCVMSSFVCSGNMPVSGALFIDDRTWIWWFFTKWLIPVGKNYFHKCDGREPVKTRKGKTKGFRLSW